MQPYKRPPKGAYTFLSSLDLVDERVRNAPPRMQYEVRVERLANGKRKQLGTITVLRRNRRDA